LRIIFFAHPEFIHSQSMPRYARMLAAGMEERGHEVKVWQPSPFFYKFKAPSAIRKWLGYIDQYFIFPMQTRKRIKRLPPDTFFVFTDHALGPWVSLVKDRPHIIHCHDFLAQRSALGEFKENPVSLSGRLYQALIRKGYRNGKNFISVSDKTRDDLHQFLINCPPISEVVYNGLNQQFEETDVEYAKKMFGQKTGIDLSEGYLLHVGGNQWYKNRLGVIEIYNALLQQEDIKLPLLLIGTAPSEELKKAHELSSFKEQIYFLTNIDDQFLRLAYSGATAFLFPSLAEGFGWPIAEAMASGCPVITTNEKPMTEVGGCAAFFISRKPADKEQLEEWTASSANVVKKVLQLAPEERQEIIQKGFTNIERFDPDSTLNRIEKIYQRIHHNKIA
jgi:glycosyltransferase involved in cell wall biosynthesis